MYNAVGCYRDHRLWLHFYQDFKAKHVYFIVQLLPYCSVAFLQNNDIIFTPMIYNTCLFLLYSRGSGFKYRLGVFHISFQSFQVNAVELPRIKFWNHHPVMRIYSHCFSLYRIKHNSIFMLLFSILQHVSAAYAGPSSVRNSQNHKKKSMSSGGGLNTTALRHNRFLPHPVQFTDHTTGPRCSKPS
jgi:hypothetical protein